MSAKNPLEALTSRRRFIRDAAVTAAVAGVATACKPTGGAAAAASVETAHGQQPTGGTMGPHDTSSAVAAMDAAHEKGIKAFPAATKGKGNQLLAPRMDGKVKVFEMTAKKFQWEV